MFHGTVFEIWTETPDTITVFLKGCPLCCDWCQYPVGNTPEPEIKRIGKAFKMIGSIWSVDALVHYIRESGRRKIIFGGGEPLLQAEFTCEVISALDGFHITLETTGYGETGTLLKLARLADHIIFRLFLTNELLAKSWNGNSCHIILKNLRKLDSSGIPYILQLIKVPELATVSTNKAPIDLLCASLKNCTIIEHIFFEVARETLCSE